MEVERRRFRTLETAKRVVEVAVEMDNAESIGEEMRERVRLACLSLSLSIHLSIFVLYFIFIFCEYCSVRV